MDHDLQAAEATHPTALTNALTRLRYAPRVPVTDDLDSYPVAHRRADPGVERRRSKYLNSRVDNAHQPTRQQQRGTHQ